MTTRYWCCRIDKRHIDLLNAEAIEGRLRQGWGYDPGQDLKNMTVDKGASRNRRMLEVKTGDIVLVPHLPNMGMVTLMRATKDWGEAYRYSIFEETGDHGHIFPVEYLKSFQKNGDAIPASMRDTFRSPGRFWNVDRLADEIDAVIRLDQQHEVCTPTIERWRTLAAGALTRCRYSEILQTDVQRAFSRADWEYLIADALEIVHPGWTARRVGGRTEVEHGTDVLLTTPAPCADHLLGIAIQVKDYTGQVGEHPIRQVQKARNGYWEDVRIVECVVAIIGGDPDDNDTFAARAEAEGVRIMWATDVQELMLQASLKLAANQEAH